MFVRTSWSASWLKCCPVKPADQDPVAAAVQSVLDTYGDGWSLAHYVVCIGLERVTADGEVESTPFWLAQPGQAEYVSDGLLRRVDEIRACTPEYE